MDDPVAAHSFNNAVWLFGVSLENELNRNPRPTKEDRKEEQRRARILARWLKDPKAPGAPEEAKPAKAFATPRPTK